MCDKQSVSREIEDNMEQSVEVIPISTQMQDDTNHILYGTLVQSPNVNFNIARKYLITHSEIHQLSDPNGQLCNNIINGYLWLLPNSLKRVSSELISLPFGSSVIHFRALHF